MKGIVSIFLVNNEEILSLGYIEDGLGSLKKNTKTKTNKLKIPLKPPKQPSNQKTQFGIAVVGRKKKNWS